MSATFSINNYSPANILETAQLNADVAASGSPVTLNTVNNNNIAANDFIIIGKLGAESSELKQVTSVAGSSSVVIPSLSLPHSRNDEVTKLFGDKITVYRASNVNGTQPADTAFAVFTGSVISIDTDQTATNFTDPNGSSDYWYKFVYTNTVTSQSTGLSDSSSARGQGFGDYAALSDIRKQAGFSQARYITDEMIDQKRQAAQATINSALAGKYTLPFATPVNPQIEDITIRLAAGYLLMEQYDRNSANYQSGEKMLQTVTNDKGTGDLDKLQAGLRVLVDTAGTVIANADSLTGFNGLPNSDTASADPLDGGGDFMFRVSDIAGYQTRKY